MPGAAPIRVLHVIGASSIGGVQAFVSNLARDIDASRFALSVCIFDHDGPAAAELRRVGVDVLLLPRPRTIIERWRLLRYMAAHRFDVLHTSVGSRATHYIAKLAGCRMVIQHLHGEPDVWHERSMSGPERTAHLMRLIRGAHLVLVPSAALAEQLRSLRPELAGPLQVLHNGVPLSDFDQRGAGSHRRAIRGALGIPADAIVVGFVGRIVEQKGIRSLISIAGHVLSARPGVHVVVVGDGSPPLVDRLREFAAARAAPGTSPSVHVVGSRQDTSRWMAAFDLLLVPSAWEAFGIVNVEAMAASLPVAGFATGGIPEVVLHEQTGLLAPPGDDDALVQHVLRLIDDASLRQRLGLAGRERAELCFDSRVIARRVEQLYTQLCPR